MPKELMVTISRTRYAELIRAEMMLAQLEDAGVDNWGGYEIDWEALDAAEESALKYGLAAL